MKSSSRRDFLKLAAAGGALAGMSDFMFLGQLPPVSAAETSLESSAVQLQPEIEPLVRFLEETPRERLLEEVAARIHDGLSYRDLLAALLLAGVRNVEPRPSVGFKFHAVLVVNSAHLASLASPPEHRWLPIFWALDYFKSAQAQDERERHWTMSTVNEEVVPSATRARKQFIAAMDEWDESAADGAVAALARTHGATEIYELFFRYGARDFRSIGHKAIYVANSWRTLQCIGWRHAEPVLRSLAYALLMHDGSNPARGDDLADLPWRENERRARDIRPDWLAGALDDEATTDLMASLRNDSYQDACDHVVELLNRGVAPQSIWDGLLAGAGELLVRQPGIVALHAVTTSNAMRFAFDTSGNDDTRRMLLLQNAAFLPLFRNAMDDRGSVGEFRLDQFQPAEVDTADQPLIDQILADISGRPMEAASKVMTYLGQEEGGAKKLIDAARLMVFLKGNDSHDYKFSSAVLEDYYHLSPGWRDRYLASSVFKLQGSGQADNDLVQRTRAALA